MINKETNNNVPAPKPEKDSGFKDVVDVNVQAHLVIKDKDTGKVLVNKRG